MRTLFLLFALCLLFPLVARAHSEEDLEKAELLFNDGQRLYDARDYEGAFEKYKEAYLLSGSPELLFNMGQCLRLLGEKEEALASYKAFVARATDPESIKKAEALIAEVEASLTPMTAEPERGGKQLKRFLLPGGLVVVSLGCGAAALAFKTRLAEPDENGVVTQTLAQHRLGLALALASDVSMIGAGVGLVFALKKREISASMLPASSGVVALISF